jgi:transposase
MPGKPNAAAARERGRAGPPDPGLTVYSPPGTLGARHIVHSHLPRGKRSQGAQTYVEQLCQVDAGVARANQLIQAFLAIVRERRGHDLEAWMAAATDSGIADLARFARGLQEDLAAVTAGLTLDWSNGVTEGQIHRLKLVQRQGYGRPGFALLRQRVLQVA